jgi:hypothetical protein
MSTAGFSRLRILLALIAGSAQFADAQAINFIRQFGTSYSDSARAVAEYGGSVYVAGGTYGNFPGRPNTFVDPYLHGFLRKYSSSGGHQWTRQFGIEDDHVYTNAVAVSSDGVYVAGTARGALPGFTNRGGFVSKYDARGKLLWTIQFDKVAPPIPEPPGFPAEVELYGVATHANGVYVAGSFLSRQRSTNIILIKLNPAGKIQWTRTLGSSGGEDVVTGVAADETGIYLGGRATGALPGRTSAGGVGAFVIKYDKSGDRIWVRQFGDPNGDEYVGKIAVESGGVYITGSVWGALPGQTGLGLHDAWIQKYDTDGAVAWTRQFGTPGNDFGWGVAADGDSVYVVGQSGDHFAFVRKYGADGSSSWTTTFGSPYPNGAGAFGVTAVRNRVYVVGGTAGPLPGQTHLGDLSDAFLIRFAGGDVIPDLIVGP